MKNSAQQCSIFLSKLRKYLLFLFRRPTVFWRKNSKHFTCCISNHKKRHLVILWELRNLLRNWLQLLLWGYSMTFLAMPISSWKITKNLQFQRFYRDLVTRLIVKLNRANIVDFHLTIHIGNIMGNHMISFIFSSECVNIAICLRAQA